MRSHLTLNVFGDSDDAMFPPSGSSSSRTIGFLFIHCIHRTSHFPVAGTHLQTMATVAWNN
jgi:hypothetical protein